MEASENGSTMSQSMFVAKHKYGYLWEVRSRSSNGPSYQVVLKHDGSVRRVTNVSSLRSLNPTGSTASRLLSAIRSVSPPTKPLPQSATVIEAPRNGKQTSRGPAHRANGAGSKKHPPRAVGA